MSEADKEIAAEICRANGFPISYVERWVSERNQRLCNSIEAALAGARAETETLKAVIEASRSASTVLGLVQRTRTDTWDKAIEIVRDKWLAAYPVEVFPEPPPPPTECSRDVISAAMGRHIATKLMEEFTAAKGE